jgi:hypothetical protein
MFKAMNSTLQNRIDCRVGCGACCIAPSISSPLPGLPQGKLAGERCLNLDENFTCRLWGSAKYPDVCKKFVPQSWICGGNREQALTTLGELEAATAPI